jgi:uncharacterized protein YebE (UPF0316 family)
MKNPITTILVSYAVVILLVIIYTVYLAFTLADNQSLGIPFAFVGVLSCGMSAVSFTLILIFHKQLKEVWPILIPEFVFSSIIPGYFLYSWLSKL